MLAVSKSYEGEPIRLLFVGRVVQGKGLNDLLEAVSLVDTCFQLEIVGAGPYLPHLQELEDCTLGIADRIHFCGWYARSALIERYQQADVFVFSSLDEGLPNAVLEALACGMPVIATDIPGNLELLTFNDNVP